MKRRLILLPVGLAAVGLVALVFMMRPPYPPDRIRDVAENLSALRPGLTKVEVAELLGGPPGEYVTAGGGAVRGVPEPSGVAAVWQATEEWVTDDAAVRVFYDADSRVLFAGRSRTAEARQSFWHGLRHWLHLD
jgi:hypothetical protein